MQVTDLRNPVVAVVDERSPNSWGLSADRDPTRSVLILRLVIGDDKVCETNPEQGSSNLFPIVWQSKTFVSFLRIGFAGASFTDGI